jgi:hypothetical protein
LEGFIIGSGGRRNRARWWWPFAFWRKKGEADLSPVLTAELLQKLVHLRLPMPFRILQGRVPVPISRAVVGAAIDEELDDGEVALTCREMHRGPLVVVVYIRRDVGLQQYFHLRDRNFKSVGQISVRNIKNRKNNFSKKYQKQ